MLAELELQSKLDSNGIEQKVSSREHSGAGISCDYYPLGGGLGLKMYRGARTEKRRDNNYMMQEHMHKLGFGPKVFNKVKIGDLCGFVTEACTIGSTIYEKLKAEEGRAAALKFYDELTTATDKLENKLPPYIHACDTGSNNVGYTDEGKLVFTDFGNFSIMDTPACIDETKTEVLRMVLDKHL